MDGILVLDKPAGVTSFSLVRDIRRITQTKVGHAGTLDPLATGILPLCLGRATRRVSHIMSGRKVYIAEATIGITTDTEDRSGKVLSQQAVTIDRAQVAAALNSFLGESQQIPPMYSALKHKGKRLYQLARQGKLVERAPRPISIDHIELLAFENGEYPRLKFRVGCSKGTYIRTLCKDLGERLGCGAHMSELRRTQCGPFKLEHAIAPEQLAAASTIKENLLLY